METKGIDLTKCVNLRFKAKVDGKEVTGKIERPNHGFILTGDDEFGCAVELHELDTLLREARIALKDGNFFVTDFEIIPRDPETYKDWQVGDRARNPRDNWSDSAYKEIIFRSGELVICKDGNGDISGGYTCGQLHRLGYRLVVTDIEKQIIEEKEVEWNPQNGDICYVKAKNDWIFITKASIYCSNMYVGFCIEENKLYYNSIITNIPKELRPATEEEKKRLFDAMAKEGKRWNAEKKVVEDIPKPYEFKARDIVMVRDAKERWKLMAFVAMSNGAYKYEVTNGEKFSAYKQCIPYNEKTMHLLGTGEDYKEDQ